MMIILTCLLWTTPIDGRLEVQEIKDNVGFTIIKLDDVKIVTETDIILHIINPIELIEIINSISTNIKNLDIQNKDLLLTELQGLTNKVQTIIPRDQRFKRGLINIVGSASKWLFGTMDEEDRQKIEEKLKILEFNNHNIVNGFQGQIRINDQVNKTLVQLKNIILKDRNLILKEFNELSSSLKQNLYYDQLLKIQLLKEKIEHIQDNIVSARHGILHPNILTDEEIKYYNIDFYKLQYVKMGVTKFQNNTLIFAIKIPKTFTNVQLKTIIPLPNKEKKEIDYTEENIIEINNITYKYKELTTINELRVSKHCIFKKNCNLIKNNKTEIITLDDETIVIKNAFNLTLNHTCDKRNFKLSGNILIHYNNCTLRILNHVLSNTKEIIKERFYYPNIEEYNNFTEKISFEEIILNLENNIKEVEEIKNQKNISIGLNMIIIIILKLAFIPITFLFVKCCLMKKRIQENSISNGGEVIYTDANEHLQTHPVDNKEKYADLLTAINKNVTNKRNDK